MWLWTSMRVRTRPSAGNCRPITSPVGRRITTSRTLQSHRFSPYTHTHTHKKKKKEKKKKTMADCAVHDSTDGLAHPEGRKDRDDERDSPVNRRLTDERSEKRAGHQVEELGKDGVRTLLASLQKHLRLRVRRVQLKKELTGLRLYASQVYRIPLRRNKRKKTRFITFFI